jgi:hypothetical protein
VPPCTGAWRRNSRPCGEETGRAYRDHVADPSQLLGALSAAECRPDLWIYRAPNCTGKAEAGVCVCAFCERLQPRHHSKRWQTRSHAVADGEKGFRPHAHIRERVASASCRSFLLYATACTSPTGTRTPGVPMRPTVVGQTCHTPST